jgi:outer membrane murein-binding lipoprotein Lpp
MKHLTIAAAALFAVLIAAANAQTQPDPLASALAKLRAEQNQPAAPPHAAAPAAHAQTAPAAADDITKDTKCSVLITTVGNVFACRAQNTVEPITTGPTL